MKKAKNIFLGILILSVLGLGYWGYSFYYQTTHFLSTEDSKIGADIVTITPEITGKVLAWNVKEGDMVEIGQVLGKQDVSMLLSSNAMNPTALSSTADSIVSKADIKAPIGGKVIHSTVVEGQVLSPGMEAAMIADTAHLYIKANIKETEIFKVKVGQVVDITIDAFGKKPFTGFVSSIGQATTSTFSAFPTLNTSGNFTKQTQLIPVKISIVNNENLDMMPGMNTIIKIHVK